MKLGAGELGLDDKPAMLEEEGVHSLVRVVVHHMLVRVMEVEVHNLAPVEVAVVGLHSLALEAEELHMLALVAHNLAPVVEVEHSLVQGVHNLVRVGHN